MTRLAFTLWLLLAAAPVPGQEPGPGGGAARVVAITARRFAFDPPEIRLRQGEPVTLRVTSRDVTHGLFLRPLGIDLEIAPGKVAEVTVTPAVAGRFTAICDHYCGTGHGGMHLVVVVDGTTAATAPEAKP